MPVRNIVLGQSISSDKIAFAKKLRSEMTPEERLVWERIRANRLLGLRFRRQQVINGFIADFYCHSVALVVEIDGPVHQQQTDYDRARDTLFQQRGFKVLRFTNEEVRSDLDTVIQRIAVACEKS